VVVLIAGGAGALALSRPHSGSGGSGRGDRSAVATAAAARSQAADWVSREVSHSAILSCDPAMCAVLQADGLQAANLIAVSSNTADPLGADVVVATPAVRSQFGRSLASVYAPAVLARFGSGPAEIDIRVVAPGGAAAYRTALSQDVAARKSVSAQLLKNSRIKVATAAQTQLAAGQVDARLLLMLAALAHVHPVRVLSFGDAGPRADPGMPLCSAELAGSYYPASMSQASYVSWLQKFLGAQRPPYNSQVSTATAQGQTVATVRFAEPSPLGLVKDG
jgi:hypothetical protein